MLSCFAMGADQGGGIAAAHSDHCSVIACSLGVVGKAREIAVAVGWLREGDGRCG